MPGMSKLLQDLRYAVRMMTRNPGFTVATLTLLVLSLAANNAIFGLVNSILLRPLPGVQEPQKLFGIVGDVVSYPTYLDFRSDAGSLTDLAGYAYRSVAVGVAGESSPGGSLVTSGNYFAVLGARPALGRLLLPSDDQPGATPAAVASERFWRKTLRSDPGAVGRTLSVNGVAVAIVGVAQSGFRGLRVTDSPDLFLPIALWPQIAPSSYRGLSLDRRSWGWVSLVGRMKPAASLPQVESALNRSLRRQRELHPRDGAPEALKLQSAVFLAPGDPKVRQIMTRFFGLLSAVVGVVLIIGCANVANLLLARGNTRRREIAVRLSIGASSGRLVRQLLTESILLAAVAGGLSLLAVQFINEALGRFVLPGGASLGALDLGPGWPMLAFTALVSLATGMLFGLAPALRSVRSDLVGELRGGSEARPIRRRGGPLLITQVTLSVVLLAGAGLFVRSLQRALSLDPGFRMDHIAAAGVDLGLVRYEPEQAKRFYAQALERVAALPGVTGVTLTSLLPMVDEVDRESFEVEGYTPTKDEVPAATFQVVGEGYARLLAIPVVQGREFGAGDDAGAPRVAMINEGLAKRFWQGRSPLGTRITVLDQSYTVVGVMKDVQLRNLTDPASPTLYLPMRQSPASFSLFGMKILVATRGNPESVVSPLRAALAAVDANAPVVGAGTLEERLRMLLTPQRMAASLMGWLSALALIIVAVGIYGAVAYEVTRRTREIGIRVALGATPSSLLRLVVGRNLGFLLLGMLLGAPLAVALGSAASSFLYGVGAADPMTFVATALVLLSAGGLASYLPARRAARVDPMNALRCE
jgi:predicted permease